MSDRILTLAQAAKVVPLSRTTLYRVAEAGADDSPFRKRGGRWLTSEADLLKWVRSGPRTEARREGGARAGALAEIRRLRDKVS